MPLRGYIAHHMGPTEPYAHAEDVLYHFGDNDFEVCVDGTDPVRLPAHRPDLLRASRPIEQSWPGFYEHYVRPPLMDSAVRGSLSFGMGGSGSGVPFHTHGPVFAEVLHGRKVWRDRRGPHPPHVTRAHRSFVFMR